MVSVKEKVIDAARSGDGELNARRLFITFCAHARINYKYAATKIKGNEGNTLLDRPENEIVTVDCASLADAFVELLNEVQPDQNAQRAEVGHGDGFATAAQSRCFDTTVAGNIRKPGENWAATKRCVFGTHYFVESGSSTRTYYDPCMFTTYSTLDEVMSWKFVTGVMNMVKRIQGDPATLLVRLPPNYNGTMPTGFVSGFVQFKKSDFKKDEYSALWGRNSMPSGWSNDKYEGKKAAAIARVNSLLNKQAGVQGAWA